MQQVRRRKERGFTIIELVVVILLLGILAAVALPRFINVTDRAYGSAVEGVYGGFATGVAMYRAQFVAEGQPTRVRIDNVPLDFDRGTGYPEIANAAACVNIWEAVLQSGRPSLADSGEVLSTGGATLAAADLVDVGTTGADFEYIFDAGDTSTTPAGPASCYYVYTAQYSDETGDMAADADPDTEVTVIHYRADGELNLLRI